MKGLYVMLYGLLVFIVCWLLVYIDNYCKNSYKLEAVVGSKGSELRSCVAVKHRFRHGYAVRKTKSQGRGVTANRR